MWSALDCWLAPPLSSVRLPCARLNVTVPLPLPPPTCRPYVEALLVNVCDVRGSNVTVYELVRLVMKIVPASPLTGTVLLDQFAPVVQLNVPVVALVHV